VALVLQRVSTFRSKHFHQLLNQYFVSLKIPSRLHDYFKVSVMNKFHNIRVSRLLHRPHSLQFKATFIHDIFSYVNLSILVPHLFYVNVMRNIVVVVVVVVVVIVVAMFLAVEGL
jgi:hypothetical protein